MVSDDDKDTRALENNMKKANISWYRLQKILTKGKMKNPKAATSIYKAIVHAVLLYGSETWAVTTSMINKLENFHRKCARHITGQHIRNNRDGTWEYPQTTEIFRMTGLEPMTDYIERRRKTVSDYLTPESQAMKDLISSVDIDINVKEVIWWKPEIPIPNLT